jgi:hypothetical protein
MLSKTKLTKVTIETMALKIVENILSRKMLCMNLWPLYQQKNIICLKTLKTAANGILAS